MKKLLFLTLFLVSCGEVDYTSINESLDKHVVLLRYGAVEFDRVTIDGVDCIVGGTRDFRGGAAISCNWK